MNSTSKMILSIAIILSLCTVSGLSDLRADTPDPAGMSPEERRAAYETMNDEERKAAKQKAIERYKNMTPEERAALKEKIKRNRDAESD